MDTMKPKKTNWENKARILWSLLVKAAQSGEKKTYGELAPLIDTIPLRVGWALDPIQHYCLDNKLPPLNALAISKTTGLPGDGFIAWDIDTLDEAYPLIFSFDWSSIPNPFNCFKDNSSIDFVDQLVKKPDRSEEVYSIVKNRGFVQQIFRSALLKAYNFQCAICGLSYEESLEAAHIISWSDSTPELRIDPRNGILLCSVHHKLFDSDWLSIDKDYKIICYDSEMKIDGPYSEMDKYFVVHFHNKKISLPKDKMLHPGRELLQRRFDRWQRENYGED
ncbi:MAG: hypothetical protein BWK80_22330 [Desulfobacteraceae bacterium IS3]|nr:MAG: hypothetical protein BWK80_22330 [Desulfobacteraceae bacterium IS3]